MNSPGKYQRRFADIVRTAEDRPVKIKNRYGYLYMLKISGRENIKTRIVVRKKVGQAVYRNYIKRIIRAYIRGNRSKLYSYNDFVFYFNSGPKATFKDICNELDERIIHT